LALVVIANFLQGTITQRRIPLHIAAGQQVLHIHGIKTRLQNLMIRRKYNTQCYRWRALWALKGRDGLLRSSQ
jgi:hypothetical protein